MSFSSDFIKKKGFQSLRVNRKKFDVDPTFYSHCLKIVLDNFDLENILKEGISMTYLLKNTWC